MHLIVSKKLNLVHSTPSKTLDSASVRSAVNSGSFHSYIAADAAERDAHIQRQTAQGFTCHVFDYADSFQSVTTIQSIRAA